MFLKKLLSFLCTTSDSAGSIFFFPFQNSVWAGLKRREKKGGKEKRRKASPCQPKFFSQNLNGKLVVQNQIQVEPDPFQSFSQKLGWAGSNPFFLNESKLGKQIGRAQLSSATRVEGAGRAKRFRPCFQFQQSILGAHISAHRLCAPKSSSPANWGLFFLVGSAVPPRSWPVAVKWFENLIVL